MSNSDFVWQVLPNGLQLPPWLGNSVMVARVTLNHLVGVQIPVPQFRLPPVPMAGVGCATSLHTWFCFCLVPIASYLSFDQTRMFFSGLRHFSTKVFRFSLLFSLFCNFLQFFFFFCHFFFLFLSFFKHLRVWASQTPIFNPKIHNSKLETQN